jgi:hypothetical protein
MNLKKTEIKNVFDEEEMKAWLDKIQLCSTTESTLMGRDPYYKYENNYEKEDEDEDEDEEKGEIIKQVLKKVPIKEEKKFTPISKPIAKSPSNIDDYFHNSSVYSYSYDNYSLETTQSNLHSQKDNSINIKHLTSYLENRNIQSLCRFFIKSGFISISSNCFEFNPIEIGDSMDILMQEYGGRIKNDVEVYYKQVLINTEKHLDSGIKIDLKALKEDIGVLIKDIYMTPSHYKITFDINTYEELHYVIKEAVIRSINIDSDILNNPFDFSALRIANATLRLVYIGGGINEIILFNDNYSYSFPNSLIYNVFKTIKVNNVVEPTIDSEDEVVSINGKEYSKALVEEMIECKIENLLNNLEIEKLLQKTKERRTGDGNSNSLQDIKLL